MLLPMITPLLAAMALTVGVTALHRRLPPRMASRAVAVAMVVVVGAALPTTWIVGLAYLAHTPIVGDGLEWCSKALGIHESVPGAIGFPALVIAVLGSVRAVRALRTQRQFRHDGPGFVEIAGHHRPFAFTLPGRGGHIILSSALIDLLDDEEQAVVLAHEATHGRHRHDRYLLISQIAVKIIPLLRPLGSRLEFSLERWADEAAVGHCGDRRFVAKTLRKVALGNAAPLPALSFAGLGVAARVAALLAPPVGNPRQVVVLAVWSVIASAAVLAMFQIHRLAGLVTALCPG